MVALDFGFFGFHVVACMPSSKMAHPLLQLLAQNTTTKQNKANSLQVASNEREVDSVGCVSLNVTTLSQSTMFSALFRSASSRLMWSSRIISSIRNITPSSSFQQLLIKPSTTSSLFNNITERGLAGKALLKTNKSAAKRFRVRGNDRIKRNKAGRSHNTGHKGRKRINQLAASAPIKGKGIEDRMRRLIRA